MKIVHEDVVQWKHHNVTRKLYNLLKDYKDICKENILQLNEEKEETFFKEYYYLRGQIEAITAIIDAELEDDNNEEI